MADVLRSCAKTACRWPAAASLSYRYATRQVWLLDLSSPDPSLYDLCPHHADQLVVPRGWQRVDDRTAHDVMVEPSASDRAERAARRRAAAAEAEQPALVTAGRSRYAALVEQLPRLAAEVSAGEAQTPVTIRSGPTADAAAGPPTSGGPAAEPPIPPRASQPPTPPRSSGRIQARAPAPIPSRELAPLPPRDWRTDLHHPVDAEDDLPGQLAIDVDRLADEGVVVSLDFNGPRRRPRA